MFRDDLLALLFQSILEIIHPEFGVNPLLFWKSMVWKGFCRLWALALVVFIYLSWCWWGPGVSSVSNVTNVWCFTFDSGCGVPPWWTHKWWKQWQRNGCESLGQVTWMSTCKAFEAAIMSITDYIQLTCIRIKSGSILDSWRISSINKPTYVVGMPSLQHSQFSGVWGSCIM